MPAAECLVSEGSDVEIKRCGSAGLFVRCVANRRLRSASFGVGSVGGGFGPRDTYALRMIGALLCQSAAGEGRVGRHRRDDAALRMGRLRAAALRLRPKSETFKTVFRQAEGLLECTAETSRSINLASLASSGFTTFWCQKVAPKASAGRKSRGTAAGLRLKRYADELAPAFLDGASDARSVSRFFARRSLRCGARKQDDLFPQDTGLRIGLSYLRTEDCGARILRASAGGGFGPRGAKAPQCCGRMS